MAHITVAVSVLYEVQTRMKHLRVNWNGSDTAGPWKTWEGILCLTVKALACPVEWLNDQWRVIGTVPGDEGIIVSARIDPTIKGKVIVVAVPPKPFEFNYVVGAQFATLLTRALAMPDTAYTGECEIGRIRIYGPDAIHHAAEELCRTLPDLPTTETPSLPAAAM